MRKLTAVATLLVLGLVSGTASAQHDHGRRGYHEHSHHDHHGGDRRDFRSDNDRHDYRRVFRRGDRLPYEYRSRQYVVEEWRRHRLSPPPRAHRWIQIGAQYVLVSMPTGIVANVIFMR